MRKIKIGANEYPVRWTIYSQMIMERVMKNNADLLETNISSLAVSVYAALMGADKNFAHDIEWILVEMGQDMGQLRDAIDVVKQCTEEFKAINDALNDGNEGNATAPKDGAE